MNFKRIRLWSSIVDNPSHPLQNLLPHVEAELYTVGRILTASQVLKWRGLRNAVLIDASSILNRP